MARHKALSATIPLGLGGQVLAPSNRLRNRRRPVERGDRILAGGPADLPGVVRTPRMLDRVFGRGRRESPAARRAVSPGEEPPDAGKSGFVAGGVRGGDGSPRLFDQTFAPPLGGTGRLPLQAQEEQARKCGAQPIRVAAGVDRLLQEELCPGKLAHLEKRLAEVRDEREPEGITFG